jgi:hypothetical protein
MTVSCRPSRLLRISTSSLLGDAVEMHQVRRTQTAITRANAPAPGVAAMLRHNQNVREVVLFPQEG